MFVNIRMLPGREIPEYRIEITEKPGTRPVVPPHVRTTEGLRDFLCKKLGEPKSVASRVISELEAMPFSSSVIEDTHIDPTALTQILREMHKEETMRLDALP